MVIDCKSFPFNLFGEELCQKIKHIGMVKITGGRFMMGSDNGNTNEQPVHEITVSTFYFDQHEVTNAEYEEITGKKSPSLKGLDGPNQPVFGVSWNDANNYCKAIGKRLPTEAEWEYAARGESHEQEYPTLDGNQPTTGQARYDSDGTAEVCSYIGNYVLWGGEPICDLAGNVWEWVNDWYGNYPKESVKNPMGCSNGTNKVLRGGCWLSYDSANLSAAFRGGFYPVYGFSITGFRCASSEDSNK